MTRNVCSMLCLITSLTWADQVTMKNGDRLSGSIVKYDGKNLLLKSEFAGPVVIPWEAVTAINSAVPVNVELKDGQTVVGVVTTTPDAKGQIATQATGTVTTGRDAIVKIRSAEEQKAYQEELDRFRNPRLIDLWTGTLDLAYATSRGNSKTDTFTLGATATRATARDKISVGYTPIFSSNDATGKRITTANAKRGGIEYNLNVRPRMFVFGSVGLETDQFQSLDLRFVPAGGLGYHAVKTEKTILDLQLGASADREFYSTGLNRTFAEVLAGEEFTYKLGANSVVKEKLVFFPNMSEGGNYRINFDTTMATAIRKWFNWQFSVSDRYLSNPIAGRKSNDLLLTTGVRLIFK